MSNQMGQWEASSVSIFRSLQTRRAASEKCHLAWEPLNSCLEPKTATYRRVVNRSHFPNWTHKKVALVQVFFSNKETSKAATDLDSFGNFSNYCNIIRVNNAHFIMTPTSQHKKEKTPEKKQKKYDLSSVPEASLIVNHRLWSGSIALDQPTYKKGHVPGSSPKTTFSAYRALSERPSVTIGD